MLLPRRRSRSENRKVEKIIRKNDIEPPPDDEISRVERTRRSRTLEKRAHLERMETFPGMGRRQTSAELISEAKNFLGSMSLSNGNLTSIGTAGVVGVRLLNTQRPMTPRESGRALYGEVSLAGRPPSAFSLKYLRNEGLRISKTPSLEPIRVQGSLDLDTTTTDNHAVGIQRKIKNSSSLDEQKQQQSAIVMINNAHENGGSASSQTKIIPKKLPSLEIEGVAVAVEKMKVKPTSRTYSNILRNYSADTNKAVDLLTTRKFLIKSSNNILAQCSTEKLIDLLKEHAGLKECSEETVVHISSILNELYERVRQSEKSVRRAFILGGLYGLVESTSPKILLSVARVVLALRVTGSNLTGACKLIFKVARNEENDILFHDSDLLELLIDGLGRASPLDDPEACIYGYGSIRFLTSSNAQERANDDVHLMRDENRNCVERLQLPRKPSTAPVNDANRKPSTENYQKFSKQCTLVERLTRHGAVELMILHLQLLNEAGAAKKLSGAPLHSLYQLSAALRSFADVSQVSSSLEKRLIDRDEQVVSSAKGKILTASPIQLELACPHLIRAAEISIGELEIQGNIVRTLSVLSDEETCCRILSNFTARIGMLLGPCLELFNRASEKLLSLFSRLGYILGNIMAKYDDARKQFYHNDVAMEYLLKVMQLYAKEPLTLQNAMGDTVVDVLIKMIRVVANMSVNSEVGFGLGNTYALGGLLLELLDATQNLQHSQQKKEIQELTLATLGALHNLCFYQDQNLMPAQVIPSEGSLQTSLLDVTATLFKIVREFNDPIIVVEAARVLGNITRNNQARMFFCKIGGLIVTTKCIIKKHNNSVDFLDYDLKACIAGILVNLLGDAKNRLPFVQMNGFSLLKDLLKLALVKNHDWFLATIICQAFWNLLIDAPRMTDVCDESSLDEICDLLSDYLDEQLFDNVNIEEADALWEGFAVVATDLLERIQNSFEQESQNLMDNENTERDKENDDEDVVCVH